MLKHTQTTSEEEWCTGPTKPITSAEKAFRVASAYAKTRDQEWLIGLYLNHTFDLIDRHQVFLSRTCEPAPLEALEALIDAALSCQPGSLVAVRHHAGHPWRGPRTPGMRRFWAFWQQAEAQGIVLYDLVIGDSTGQVYSIRGDWEEVETCPLSRIASGLVGFI